ncbi:MAG: hypothetical protein JST41_13330 [Bacteroidetes bacterium]|jgi:hypothetical protein|nr:hypothetical protein [Bacteroidota bacterium]MBX7130094.1 hypothetical protein [Flavobacteriales bacterium]MCC6656208.1 hypothetical protein [Flavobacteriales bacterium]HMU13010.1 hypothetical protein [Flavobacteriales bacterium]HNA33223.1 hypothetical protein [Flavobacteriales bacterium]
MIRTLALGALFAVTTSASAQMGYSGAAMRTILKKGDFSALQDQTSVLLVYDYSDMTVGKFTEENYVNKKRDEYNKKESGRGDTWAGKWVGARTELYEPKFEELLNDRLASGKSALKAGKDKTDAKYVIKVHTTETEPGYNVGVSRVPGYITAVMTLYEASAPDNVLGEVEIERAPAQGAMGFDFDAGGRIAEGYAKMGKEFGTWLTKKDWGRKHK